MVKRHESLKKYIKTILDQLPQYIEAYPPEEQELLKEFLFILSHYEEADFKRRELSDKFETYRQDIIDRKKYLILPFLWFLSTYFRNALVILNNSGFHAKLFYEYLVKQLRGTAKTSGIYQLIRKGTSLSDLTWENLQFESNKLLYPLSNDQLQILKTIHSFITEAGVYVLDSRKLKAAIIKQVKFPKKVKLSDELNRFFSLIDGRWFLHFSSPAFGLDRLYIQFQLQNSSSLEDIIDFQDPANTVLTKSYIYRVRNLSNTYIGNLLVPTLEIEQLENYFQHCEREGYLIIKESTRITTTRVSTSLTHYKGDSGWIEPSAAKMRLLTTLLKSKDPKERQIENSMLFITPSFKRNWFYNQHPLPTRIIKLYCKIPEEYTYPDLPLRPDSQNRTAISRNEIGILKQLSYNEVVHIGFVPWQLVYESSLDLFWIILPIIPNFLLKRFLSLIPYSDIYYTEKSISILAQLTPKVVHWIENDLNWTVISIILIHSRHDLEFNWFDSEKLQWKTPKLLSK